MLVLGHIATATVTARWVDRKVDLRWVIFFALLADLVDKPIGLILFRESLNNGRVYFHSLLVNLLVTLILVFLHKPLVYSLALWLHQLADLMWTRPWVALWPFSGSFGYRDLPLEQWVSIALGPYNLTTEAAGCAVLVWLIWRHRLCNGQRFLPTLRQRTVCTKEPQTSREKELENREASSLAG